MYRRSFSPNIAGEISAAIKYSEDNYHSPTSANKLADALTREFDLLETMPGICPRVHDDFLAAQGIRFSMIRKYMLFFIIDKENKIVNLLCFYHGSRNWQELLRERES